MDLIPVGVARERLGISRETMTRWIKSGRFTIYANPLDQRVTLLDAEEVAELTAPVVVSQRKVIQA